MHGVWTALITPFNSSGEIDLTAFRRIVRDQIDAGIDGVIPCGTTGESPTLNGDGKKQLISAAIEETKGSKTKVVAGTGSNNTAETIALSSWASEQGVAGVLLVTPYYNKPTQAGLEAHFKSVADAVKCEVMLYNVPGRTGISLEPKTVLALCQHSRITTLKEATGNVAFTSEILDVLNHGGKKIDILSGDDATFFPLLSVGARGVVSVASNLFPRGMVSLYRAHESKNFSEAQKLHQHYYPLFRDLFVESNPGPIKYTMSRMGWCENRLRLPLVPVSKTNSQKLDESLTRCTIQRGRPA